jgi:quaternary ammonium compound-resistance protein SugE
MNQGWMYLYGGVVAAGISMPLAKLANGFENLQYSIPAIFLYIVATVCWLMAMKQLPLSTAWLIWLGMDAVIMLGVSYFMFHESFSLGKILCMLLILSGCIGLNVLEMKK